MDEVVKNVLDLTMLAKALAIGIGSIGPALAMTCLRIFDGQAR